MPPANPEARARGSPLKTIANCWDVFPNDRPGSKSSDEALVEARCYDLPLSPPPFIYFYAITLFLSRTGRTPFLHQNPANKRNLLCNEQITYL